MGAKRNNTIAVIAAGVFLGLGLISNAAEAQETTEPAGPELISYHMVEADTFTRHLPAAFDHRNARIVSFEAFADMRGEDNTIILDTRSAARFNRGHMQGAINLPLTEMTLLSLADTVPDRTSTILIYSDENIGQQSGVRSLNVAALSLNMLTYVTLYQYGYFDVFELGEVVAEDTPALAWGNDELQLARAETTSLN